MAEERKTILRRTESDLPFTMIPKTLMDDPRLSWKAKGILAYLLGKKCNWVVRIMDLCNHSQDGESSIRAGIQELRNLHYARLAPSREEGKISDWILTVSDTDNLPPEDFRKTDSPDRENQHLEKPDVENRDISKKDTTKNDPNYIPSTASQASPPKQKSKKEKTPNPDHKRFIELWVAQYETQFGRRYVFQGGKDASAVARLLTGSNLAPEALMQIARQAWRTKDFNCGRAVSISVFASAFNEIQAELAKAAKPAEQPAAPAWKRKQEMEQQIHELEGETHYDHQKRQRPDKVALLHRLRKELETLKNVPCLTT